MTDERERASLLLSAARRNLASLEQADAEGILDPDIGAIVLAEAREEVRVLELAAQHGVSRDAALYARCRELSDAHPAYRFRVEVVDGGIRWRAVVCGRQHGFSVDYPPRQYAHVATRLLLDLLEHAHETLCRLHGIKFGCRG